MKLVFSVLLVLISLLSFTNCFWSSSSDKNKKNSIKHQEKGSPSPLQNITLYPNGEVTNGVSVSILKRECANIHDLSEYICPLVNSINCTLFTSYGTRVHSCNDLGTNEYIHFVPMDRLFMWPTRNLGHQVYIRHIGMPNGKPIVLKTLSIRPRVFSLTNFITDDEADKLIENALSLTAEEFRLRRSSTGAKGYSIDSHRTSEGAFDVNSPLAKILKKRAFDLLGIHPYDETFADGLQILRYNQTNAYIPHLDWITPPEDDPDHNWESAEGGTNRYATVFFYLSDVDDGGETVFTEAKPYSTAYEVRADGDDTSESTELNFITRETAVHETNEYLKNANLSHLFVEDSWEKDMIIQCRSRLSVKPKKATAILFYSQYPDGRKDELSNHGGCPVLQGQKWAANLWVWNGPRVGYMKKNPVTGKLDQPEITAVTASFEAADVRGAVLYWENQLWEELVPGSSIKVNTYTGHVWNIKLDNVIVATYTIEKGKKSQRFILKSKDLPIY